jgi:hypothetical protein
MLEHPGGAGRQGGTAEEGTAESLPSSDQRNTILVHHDAFQFMGLVCV